MQLPGSTFFGMNLFGPASVPPEIEALLRELGEFFVLFFRKFVHFCFRGRRFQSLE